MARSPSMAHTANRAGVRHLLVNHLRAVSRMAAEFAEPLGAAEAAGWLGLWHDVGKFAPAFQEYLAECERDPTRRTRGPDHKGAGAKLAAKHLGPLALGIQGHHGGLVSLAGFKSWINERDSDPGTDEALNRARKAIGDLEPAAPVPLPPHADRSSRSAEILVRMAFSALVDADYLDTERHFDPSSADVRTDRAPRVQELWERFSADQAILMARSNGPVDRARREIYEACLEAADGDPGIYTLTVPTGGGKTRSAMAFALRHAIRNGQHGVVVAVPFITVTEQTADVYRAIIEGDGLTNAVLEHHSGRDALGADDEYGRTAVWRRLAAENWDAPIVVTTTVQLFESLFAARPGACRKLHRVARRVIIVDEAQSLPTHLLTPILDALRELTENYGTTVLLSTATRPAFGAIPVFRDTEAREIIPDPGKLFRELKRVDYEWRVRQPISWEEVASLLRDADQALAVVNTKRDAMRLLDALGDNQALHLSTSLCAAHRSEALGEVRRRLSSGKTCRVISTQVVEAGVDIDFPVVFRAVGPLDAVIQAAGRCNREGRLRRGRTVVFSPEGGGMPSGPYKTGSDVSMSVLAQRTDLDAPETVAEYFRQLFESVETDREAIQPLREALEFTEVARRFRMIRDDTASVLVPWGTEAEQREASFLLDAIASGDVSPRLGLRRLQPYLVNLYARDAERAANSGLIAWVAPGLGRWLGSYDPVRGLQVEPNDLDVLVV